MVQDDGQSIPTNRSEVKAWLRKMWGPTRGSKIYQVIEERVEEGLAEDLDELYDLDEVVDIGELWAGISGDIFRIAKEIFSGLKPAQEQEMIARDTKHLVSSKSSEPQTPDPSRTFSRYSAEANTFVGVAAKTRLRLLTERDAEFARQFADGFRTRYWDGEWLTHNEYLDFLRSPATALLPIIEFEASRIPIRDHRAWLVEETELGRANPCQVQPGHFRFVVCLGRSEARETETHTVEVCVDDIQNLLKWPYGCLDSKYPEYASESVFPEIRIGTPPSRYMEWVDTQERVFTEMDRKWFTSGISGVLTGTVLSDFAHQARHLARFFNWPAEEAYRFLATGKTPLLDAITADVEYAYGSINDGFRTSCINLSIAPFVSPTTVSKVYRHFQEKNIDAAPHKRSPLSQEIYAFVRAKAQEMGCDGEPTKKQLGLIHKMWEWPEAYSAKNTQRFTLIYKRARDGAHETE